MFNATHQAAFFTRHKPAFCTFMFGYLQYSRYREGTGLRQEFRFIKNPKASEWERIRDARTLTIDYEHLAGLAKELTKNNVAVEQLPVVKGGNTYVSPTTGLTWSDVEYQGYVIPAQLVSELIDEANAALTERAANLARGHKPAPGAAVVPA